MEGQAVSGTRSASLRVTETVLISYADSARHCVPAVARAFHQQAVECQYEEKLGAPAQALAEPVLRKLEASQLLCLVISRRCRQSAWHDAETAAAFELGIPVLVWVEDLRIEWAGQAVPTLLTASTPRLAEFVARSRPDAASVWEFTKVFFLDRATAARFRRAANGAWRWDRHTGNSEEPPAQAVELSLMEEYLPPAAPEVQRVTARVENSLPVLQLDAGDSKHYRLAYSPDIRAVLPAPVFPGAPMIGFMHADFDTGREWPRAGEPRVELRALGRDVYGWHMSEYFWRAFVGHLPKLLGQAPNA